MVQSGPHEDDEDDEDDEDAENAGACLDPSGRRDRLRRMSGDRSRAVRTFLASFLVLFLEIALIRWMPAYIRLLSYFSNFILLASFLGIGLGCLLAPARVRLFAWFPLLQAIVIGAVNYFRLEVSVRDLRQHLFFQRHRAPRSSSSRARCCCRSSSSSSRRCSRRWRRAWGARWRRCRRSVPTRSTCRQPRRRHRARTHLVAGTAAGHVVRDCLRGGGPAAADARSAGRPKHRRWHRRPSRRSWASISCCSPDRWCSST